MRVNSVSNVHQQLLSFERMNALYEKMNEQERSLLSEWERLCVDGSGRYSTSDWPGLEEMIARYSH